MKNIIKSSIIVILGAAVLRKTYVTGYCNGIKFCKDELEFALNICKSMKGKES